MQSQGKMMQDWTSEAISFLQDAAAYGSYYEQLAEFLLPCLPETGHVCDAGCGLGFLALQLAKRCGKVTAIDRSERAIAVLRKQNKAENLTPLCCDIFSHRGCYDAMVFCYFGSLCEILTLARRLCKGTVAVVGRKSREHRFSMKRIEREGHRRQLSDDWLTEQGIPHQKIPLTLEFGQPFRNLEDALRFFRLYDKSGEDIRAEQILPRLSEIRHETYSYYLPETREMDVLIFDAQAIPEEIV